MQYAVIETGGKQYRVSLGDVLQVDSISGASDTISFDKVLLFVDEAGVKIGKPYLSGTKVTAKVIKTAPGDKIRVARFTAKSRHRRVIGFRPMLTTIEINDIVDAKESTPEKKSKAVKK